MTVINWDIVPSAGDCFDDTSWTNMVQYIKHSHSCVFTIYDDESSTSQKFKFSYAGNDNTLEGDDTTAKNLILKATTADVYPYVELLGNTDIHFHKTAGRAMLFYDATTQAQKFTYAANVSTIEGGHITGDSLKLKANDVDTYPKISLFGNGPMYLYSLTDFRFYNASLNMLDMYISGTDTVLENPVTHNNTFLQTTGSGVVKFGTYTTLGAEVLAGYITIKDALGNTRKLAVIA